MPEQEIKDSVQTKSGEESNERTVRQIISSLPSSVDWRLKGALNPVKNQASCGSCWAFAAASALESHAAISTGVLPNLSEQNLVDCVYARDGCRGGWPTEAFKYIQNKSLDSAFGYPYKNSVLINFTSIKFLK
jgi:C1A family cysteine protease